MTLPTTSRPPSSASGAANATYAPPPARSTPWGTLLAGVAAIVLVARLTGPPIRRALMIDTRTFADTSTLTFAADPPEAAQFFMSRDSVHIRILRDITLGELLSLYHLRTSTEARSAITKALRVGDEDAVIQKGREVTVPLSINRN